MSNARAAGRRSPGPSTVGFGPYSEAMIVTNRGANPTSTFRAWGFYKRVREQFGGWNHVILTFPDEPDRARPCNSAEDKLVCFVDDHGRRLEVNGINFGYDGAAEIGNGKAIGMQRISQTRV